MSWNVGVEMMELQCYRVGVLEFKCSSLSGSVRVGIKVYIGVGMLMLQCLSQKY